MGGWAFQFLSGSGNPRPMQPNAPSLPNISRNPDSKRRIEEPGSGHSVDKMLEDSPPSCDQNITNLRTRTAAHYYHQVSWVLLKSTLLMLALDGCPLPRILQRAEIPCCYCTRQPNPVECRRQEDEKWWDHTCCITSKERVDCRIDTAALPTHEPRARFCPHCRPRSSINTCLFAQVRRDVSTNQAEVLAFHEIGVHGYGGVRLSTPRVHLVVLPRKHFSNKDAGLSMHRKK